MIDQAKSLNLQHQRLWMLPQKALYWQKKRILMVADLHIGKSGHFRKNGIPVPARVNRSNLDLLDELITSLDVEQLIILGDLFHSSANKEWKAFKQWRNGHPDLQLTLVIGNHDILPPDVYHASHISLFKRIKIDPFLLIHDLNELPNNRKTSNYVLSGHIHPAVQLTGKGRQKMKLPCFYFGSNQGILPAFGEFTGTHVITPKQGDKIYSIVDNRVIAI